MSLRGWRIVKSKHVDEAFSGEGARLYGGRWNSIGTRMVYTSETASLAVLEVLVHLESSALLSEYSLCNVEFDEALVDRVDYDALPENWRDDLPPPSVQAVGDHWIEGQWSVVLEVPSVILPHERNYLLNPKHTNFSKIHIGQPQPFSFDRRFLR